MNTIGTLLTKARRERGLSLERLESETRIKRVFIKAIEEEDWEKLPEYPVVLGFVRSIAGVLGIPDGKALALLRRDYPPKNLKINPNPDVEKKFSWSPKLTFLVGIGLFLLLLLGYLGLQYTKFMAPPMLEISKPKEEEVVFSKKVVVEGKTETDTTLEVNNQPIIVDADGNFSGSVEISKETTELTFKATSRSGKETEIKRKIVVEFD